MTKIELYHVVMISLYILWSICFIGIKSAAVKPKYDDYSENNYNYYDSDAFDKIKDTLSGIFIMHIINIIFSPFFMSLYFRRCSCDDGDSDSHVLALGLAASAYYTHLFTGFVFQLAWITASNATVDSWKEKVYDFWFLYVLETIFFWTKVILTFIMISYEIIIHNCKKQTVNNDNNNDINDDQYLLA